MRFTQGGAIDCLIVGGGPAGLAAACVLIDGGLDVLVVEMGPRALERGEADPRTLGIGVGGAGLYSDGKFSFYPSATRLWSLEPRTLVREGYSWFREVTRGLIDAPAFPRITEITVSTDGTVYDKRYPSIVTSRPARLRLVSALEDRIVGSLLTKATVSRLESADSLLVATIRTDMTSRSVLARSAVLAGGRFGPRLLEAPGTRVFRRLELGVRLESPADAFPLARHSSTDPKLISRSSDGWEWLTFCTCRDGELLQTEIGGIWSVSGRRDIPRSGLSNVGLNLRVRDPAAAAPALVDEVRRGISGNLPIFSLPLEEMVAVPGVGLGPLADRILSSAAVELGFDVEATQVVGPAIEGVGEYPETALRQLRLPGLPIWTAGDASGQFRGLTAAMVSGAVAGLDVLEALRGGSL